ncbi:F0F1 ATP synthase subunit I [Psychrobacter pasteurii]|uniref:F0F1 ATP synthase subunit I n=1 Tax=Psychrobacter pasteurii TaxID=1945520 RepID=A0A1R4EHM4_9GAMM|nr:ATP synthase subunit I [Psychrobacter pasteurii]SJM38027.1 F0F1 ATP synthase subunit I [Psychrobacter pasteurii]
MTTHSNTPLRASERKELQRVQLRRQARLRSSSLLIIIVIAWLLEMTLFKSNLLIPKGVALGAFINWFAQGVFAWFAFRYTGAQARQAIVSQLYLGQIIKWFVVMLGFALVFITIHPISAGAVIFGFIAMQIGHFISLWQIRKNS